MANISKGDQVFVRQAERLDHRNKLVWAWGEKEARVMAVAENYAMCRFKGCIPFVRHIDEIKLVNPEGE